MGRITEVGTVHRGTTVTVLAVIFALTGCMEGRGGRPSRPVPVARTSTSSIEAKTFTLSDPTSGSAVPTLPLARAGFPERATGYRSSRACQLGEMPHGRILRAG